MKTEEQIKYTICQKNMIEKTEPSPQSAADAARDKGGLVNAEANPESGQKPETMRRSFKERVFDVVRGIPRGSTLTYKEVAERAGSPGASR
ncbi:MAG: MGMT family protein, partial [bacterium]|nr:MGMT family protein [bacterium]